MEEKDKTKKQFAVLCWPDVPCWAYEHDDTRAELQSLGEDFLVYYFHWQTTQIEVTKALNHYYHFSETCFFQRVSKHWVF